MLPREFTSSEQSPSGLTAQTLEQGVPGVRRDWKIPFKDNFLYRFKG